MTEVSSGEGFPEVSTMLVFPGRLGLSTPGQVQAVKDLEAVDPAGRSADLDLRPDSSPAGRRAPHAIRRAEHRDAENPQTLQRGRAVGI